MYTDLQDRKAIITGAARGIGAGVAKALLAQGISVALWDIQDEPLAGLEAEMAALGTRVTSRRVDVADPAAVEAAVVETEHAPSRVDLLMNVGNGNAGTRPALVKDIPANDWEKVIGANLSSAFHCMRACSEPMRRRGGGALVKVVSIAAITLHFGASYTVAKAGLLGLTRHAAMDLSRLGIRGSPAPPEIYFAERQRSQA